MFMGVYLALCGIQYLIILIASLILIRRKVSFGELRKSLLPYSIFALSASLLGLGLFSLITIPVGNLDSDQRHKVRLWAIYDLIDTELAAALGMRVEALRQDLVPIQREAASARQPARVWRFACL